MPGRLNDARLRHAVAQLVRHSPELRGIRDRHGHPPLWQRPAGFATLLHIILEQQVSIASARAAFDRLRTLVRPLTPAGFLALDDSQLRAIGFSRQKVDYARGLASAIAEGRFSLGRIARLADDLAREQLITMRGIGRWSADIYLLMALGRPDIWPQGDLALAQAMREVLSLERRPTHDEQLAITVAWKPWRAVAARLLWHHYLSTPRTRR